MSILIWIWSLIGRWLGKEQAQQQVDTAATTRNEEAAHAAHHAQDAAPDSRSAFADSVRDGSSL